MKSFCKKKNRKTAFSLIELSIVIVIVSILITGALSVSVSAVNSAKNKVTKERMAEIYKALGNYLLSNKKLPCPALLTDTKSGSSNYGTADTGGACSGIALVSGNLVRGMVPVKTLGLPFEMAEDGFGDKFEYIVDKYATVVTALSGTNFGTMTIDINNDLTVNERPSGTDIAVNGYPILALLSFGANKSGSYGADSGTRNTTSSDAQESANTPTSTNDFAKSMYVSSGNSDLFDDVLFFKTRESLVSDFNALSLIPCSTSSDSLYGGTVSWPAAWYDQIVVSTTTCSSLGYSRGPSYAAKKCGPFGVWDQVIYPCLN